MPLDLMNDQGVALERQQRNRRNSAMPGAQGSRTLGDAVALLRSLSRPDLARAATLAMGGDEPGDVGGQHDEGASSDETLGEAGESGESRGVDASAESAERSARKPRAKRNRELDVDTAIGRLADHHRTLARLFKKLDREATKSGKRLVSSQIATLVGAHTILDERHFYPALRRAHPESAGAIDEAIALHAQMKQLLEEIRIAEVTDPRFFELVQTLRERVELHVDDEESLLFPKAEQVLGAERLRAIGGEMSATLEDIATRAAAARAEEEEALPR